MAGTLRGTVDAKIIAADKFLAAGELFKLYFDAFEAHPGTTRISLFHGAAGLGTDYHDGAAPFGDGAWSVWRFEPNGGRSWPFYVMLFTSSVTGGINGGDWLVGAWAPVAISANVSIAAAVGVVGGGSAWDGNPWNGTMLNDGTDTVGTPRWEAPAGAGDKLLPFPACNEVRGSTATLKNATVTVISDANEVAYRASIILDDDGFVVLCHEGDDGGPSARSMYMGVYEVAPHLTVPNPFVALRFANNPNTSAAYWGDNGLSDTTGTVLSLTPAWDYDMIWTAPDQQAAAYVPVRLGLRIESNTNPHRMGFLGWTPEMYSVIYGGAHGDSDISLDRMFWSDGSTTDKILCAWDGATVPFTSITRAGVSF